MATRLLLAAVAFVLVLPLSQQAATQAGPNRDPVVPTPLLPLNVGLAVATDAAITLPFETATDPETVEASVSIYPETDVMFAWNAARTELRISPTTRWSTDETYLVVIGASETSSGSAGPRRYAFTTRTAPAVTRFDVTLAGQAASDAAAARSAGALVLDVDAQPVDRGARAATTVTSTPTDVSASTAISIEFSRPMDQADVEARFAISPSVTGTFAWSDGALVFTPAERLVPGTRYTISLAGARDGDGDVLGGRDAFSFIVRSAATVAVQTPTQDSEVDEASVVVVGFDQPMDVASASAAFGVVEVGTGAAVEGEISWNDAATELTFTPAAPLAAGASFDVAFDPAALDQDGNEVTMSWSFTTTAPAVLQAAAPAPVTTTAAPAPPPAAPAPVPVPPPSPAGSLADYAVSQINASRAAYGFGPVVLDGAISAVAYSHAYDQAVNGYFSHTGLNGSTRDSRLRAGGISFSWSGENQCYLVGRTAQATLDWCHAQFMAEPYPGHWNHIANVLNPNATRVGVGIAQVGGKIVIVWDFTN